ADRPAGEGVRAAAEARFRAEPRLHEGGAAARRLGLPLDRQDADPGLARVAPAPQARPRRRRAVRRQRVGGGLQAARRLTYTAPRATVSQACLAPIRSTALGRSCRTLRRSS